MKIVAGLFFCFMCSCCLAQPAYPLHQPYSIEFPFLDSLRKAMSLISGSGGDAIADADLWIKWAKNNNDGPLAGELSLMKYKYIMTNEKKIPLEGDFMNLASYAREKKDLFLEANIDNVLGDYCGRIQKHGLALDYYLSSYNIYSKFTSEEFPLKKEYLYTLGMVYLQYGDDDNALRLFKEADHTTAPDKDYIYPIKNAIGLHYRYNGKYDSAELYFKIIYDSALVTNNGPWIGISAGNIGICYYKQGKYSEAMPLLEKDIQYSLSNHLIQNGINSMYVLADIYFRQHDDVKSEQLLMQALSIGESSAFWPNYKLAGPIYALLAKINAARNNMRTAYLYDDSALVAKDSAVPQNNAVALAKAQQKEDLIQHEADVKLLNDERKIQILIRNSLVTIILLLLSISILFINRQKMRRKKLEIEKRNAELELEMAAKSLDNFRQSIQEKNNIIDHFTQEIAQIRVGAKVETDSETLLQLERSTILTDEQWEDFRELFEKVHKGFFKRVKDKMPDLTPGEVRFVALSKLKLSPKEMSSTLGISASTIRNYRLRLRRKLGLSDDASIEDIADAI